MLFPPWEEVISDGEDKVSREEEEKTLVYKLDWQH